MTVPGLFLISSLGQSGGDFRCFYCGSSCSDEHPSAIHVKDSFTGRDGVFAPGSHVVCGGCVLCLRESADIVLIDGQLRSGQMMRGYSWVINSTSAKAATKAHVAVLRSICLDPPEPPFAICLSDSGQKHLLYRGAVNHARDPVVVTLEGERVEYCSLSLAARLTLCGKLISATGKPALRESVNARFATAVLGRFRDGESVLTEWIRVREQPLSRLAAWLAPPKEESAREYPCDFTA